MKVRRELKLAGMRQQALDKNKLNEKLKYLEKIGEEIKESETEIEQKTDTSKK